eukprot:CAMPEP_0119143124 /NCGR_PEP_ID=MMETSP1310-20130426/33843_1 /TAXON_ID=464262 /ORGANISM="Genus nov. species nov., Strain RCC2339" /LENGTH=79 /DNA_ID=CAMNT_0007134727 /DNA_START=255 /DNA_END=491 /DNA_ORIENTATION=+
MPIPTYNNPYRRGTEKTSSPAQGANLTTLPDAAPLSVSSVLADSTDGIPFSKEQPEGSGLSLESFLEECHSVRASLTFL